MLKTNIQKLFKLLINNDQFLILVMAVVLIFTVLDTEVKSSLEAFF